jgi:hypothetical protein
VLAEGVICLGLDASLGTVFSFVFMIPLHDRRRLGWMTVMVFRQDGLLLFDPTPCPLCGWHGEIIRYSPLYRGAAFLEMY